MTLDITMAVAILGAVLAILAWLDSKRRAAMAEGKHVKEVEQLQVDLTRCHEKLRSLESRVNSSDVNVGEMRADLRHILDAIGRIEGKLDGHISKEADA
jgi:predicted  nucleic acid-binding Zn-ribbon protein